jgi:hypothetical protein
MEDTHGIRPLQLTSCLFASVVVHAYVLRCATYHHIFLVVTVLSVLFHSTHHPSVALVDKCAAHLAFLFVLCDIPKAESQHKLWLVVFPLTTACLWGAQSFFLDHRERLHVALHAVAIAGLHCFLAELYPV